MIMMVIITQWIRRKLTGKKIWAEGSRAAAEEPLIERGPHFIIIVVVHSQLILSYLFRTEWVRFNSINRPNMRC